MQSYLIWLAACALAVAACLAVARLAGVWETLRPTRGVALVLLVGILVLFGTDQGRELALVAADSRLAGVFLVLGVIYWALQSWHWARMALYAQFGLDRAGWGERGQAILWLPRLYALLVHLVSAGAVVLVMLRRTGLDPRLLAVLVAILVSGALLEWLLICRIELTEAMISRLEGRRPQAAPRLRRMVTAKPAADGAAEARPMARQAPLSKLFLALSVGVFALMFLCAGWRPVEMGNWLGAAAIVFIALGTWASITSLVVILTLRWRAPVLACLIAVAFVTGWLFDAGFHKVDTFRDLKDKAADAASVRAVADRPRLKDETAAFAAHVAGEAGSGGQEGVPIVFVATAGGGLRAAYWTATILGRLADTQPGFVDHLFAISAVSGGSLGAAMVEALIAEQQRGRLPAGSSIERDAQLLLANDFLGRTVARMMYTDPLLPLSRLLRFSDRGKALEIGWSATWDELKLPPDRADPNPLDDSFLHLWRDVPNGGWRRPILLLNATHEERGKRIITSNIRITSDPFADAWDLHALLGRDLRVTTAAHNSARFTYVSPAGTIMPDDGTIEGHVLDGGYFENNGALTLLEITREALMQLRGLKLRPVIIQITSDPEMLKRDQPREQDITCGEEAGPLPFDARRDARSTWAVANEMLAPAGGLLAGREARGILAAKELARWSGCFARDEVGVTPVFIHLGMCGKARPPLGWVMAEQSREDIQAMLSPSGCNAKELKALKAALDGTRALSAASRL